MTKPHNTLGMAVADLADAAPPTRADGWVIDGKPSQKCGRERYGYPTVTAALDRYGIERNPKPGRCGSDGRRPRPSSRRCLRSW